MSFLTEKKSINTEDSNTVVKMFYEAYSQKLFGYTCKNYSINADDAWTVVYKTIYKMAEINDKYTFENEHKRRAFVFKTHINFLRNYFRDNKSFERVNHEVELKDFIYTDEEEPNKENFQLKILKSELDKLEGWQRILLLMRGQNMPYSEIAVFVQKPEKQLKVYYARLKQQLLENVNAELNKLNSQP